MFWLDASMSERKVRLMETKCRGTFMYTIEALKYIYCFSGKRRRKRRKDYVEVKSGNYGRKQG